MREPTTNETIKASIAPIIMSSIEIPPQKNGLNIKFNMSVNSSEDRTAIQMKCHGLIVVNF
jgi:hypothetical protein